VHIEFEKKRAGRLPSFKHIGWMAYLKSKNRQYAEGTPYSTHQRLCFDFESSSE
jgi:hypothetical protein